MRKLRCAFVLEVLMVVMVVLIFFTGCGSSRADARLQNGDEPNCDEPCGADELITCMAKDSGYSSTAGFWNAVLFDGVVKKHLDGFCRAGTSAAGDTVVQKHYVDTFCAEDSGTYFSYEKFVDANNAVASAVGGGYDFLCKAGTTKRQRIRDLSNFLAIGAQETTAADGSAPYTNDGYYWRWEYGALVKCCSGADLNLNETWPCSKPANTCDLDTNIYTQYTPGAGYKVAIVPGDKSKVFTQRAWSSVSDNGSGGLGGNEMNLKVSPNVLSWNNDITAPEGYELVSLYEVVDPYYWVGMGAIQLTADSVMNYFGWYHNNIESPAQETADLNAFIRNLAGDGKISFIGALWYWNYRVNGSGRPTLEKMLNSYGDGDETPCHDIAMSTLMVNGGCNDFNVRKSYYDHFTAGVFGITIDTITHIHSYSPNPPTDQYVNYELGNMKCEVTAGEPYYPAAFQDYCYPLAQ